MVLLEDIVFEIALKLILRAFSWDSVLRTEDTLEKKVMLAWKFQLLEPKTTRKIIRGLLFQ